jgi:putative SOS response-associated peptidase YedK
VCGRFTSSAPGDIVAQTFGLATTPALAPRYNLAPRQPVPAVRVLEAQRRLDHLVWGLIPAWASDAAIGDRLINARAETAAEKPAFRAALRSRRCLIVADGFYEWARRDGGKQPYLVRFRDGRPFGLGGLWEVWRGAGEPLETCTILTTTPNDVVAPLHDRMPVIIPPESYRTWLDPGTGELAVLGPLMAPFPAGEMTAIAVSHRVGNPANDDPSCTAPA